MSHPASNPPDQPTPNQTSTPDAPHAPDAPAVPQEPVRGSHRIDGRPRRDRDGGGQGWPPPRPRRSTGWVRLPWLVVACGAVTVLVASAVASTVTLVVALFVCGGC